MSHFNLYVYSCLPYCVNKIQYDFVLSFNREWKIVYIKYSFFISAVIRSDRNTSFFSNKKAIRTQSWEIKPRPRDLQSFTSFRLQNISLYFVSFSPSVTFYLSVILTDTFSFYSSLVFRRFLSFVVNLSLSLQFKVKINWTTIAKVRFSPLLHI